MSEGVGRSMDTTATTMVVTTGPEEQARRSPQIAVWAQRCAIAAHLPAVDADTALAVARTLPPDDPRLMSAAADFRQVLDALGVDVPPPSPPGTCRGCGKDTSIHDVAIGRCQSCSRRARKAARP